MPESPLVSIIIPCYNAEKWIGAALESCLHQTYNKIEIVVVDDGSVDDSRKILKKYKNHIVFKTTSHQGANQARNAGIQLSKGHCLQFLDADDYILPQKIAIQVRFLQETGADGVYGDWRHRYEFKSNKHKLGEVKISGQHDLLESLLSGWWVAPGAFLYRRGVVEKIGGWDEKLEAAQDTDFIISMALQGADIRYQPGCSFIYRRYGNVTLSTSNKTRWLRNHALVLDKAHSFLSETDRLSDRYRKALARSYFKIARNYYDTDRERYFSFLGKVMELDPFFRPAESFLYNLGQKMLGYSAVERIASLKRKMMRRIFSGLVPE